MAANIEVTLSPIEQAFTDAIMKVIGAVADGAAAGAVQATAGAQATTGGQGTVGGASGQTGLSSQGSAADVQNKVDVSAAEVIESLNVQALKDAAIANKMLVDAYGARVSSNNKLYDVTATALGLATLGTTHNMTLQQQMASDHRDQNHDKQINLDEQIAAAAALYGRLIERLNNPTPPVA